MLYNYKFLEILSKIIFVEYVSNPSFQYKIFKHLKLLQRQLLKYCSWNLLLNNSLKEMCQELLISPLLHSTNHFLNKSILKYQKLLVSPMLHSTNHFLNKAFFELTVDILQRKNYSYKSITSRLPSTQWCFHSLPISLVELFMTWLYIDFLPPPPLDCIDLHGILLFFWIPEFLRIL